ncbi:MAG: paraquat-inducible protein A [Thiohalomonadales bacterium]
MEFKRLIICRDCDAVQSVAPLQLGQVALCRCCEARLFANPKGGLDLPLALSLSTLILLIIANSFPFIGLDYQGNVQISTLSGTSLTFLNNNQIILAFVVWFSTVITPAIVVTGLLYILIALRFNLNFPYLRTLLHTIHILQPWIMMDVFMLAVLVALVKISSMAAIIYGVSLFAFILLIILFASVAATIEPQLLWERLESNSRNNSWNNSRNNSRNK